MAATTTTKTSATTANLTLPEAAHRLGVSPHTLRRWAVYDGKIRFYRLGGGSTRSGRIVFKEADLAVFERKGVVEPRRRAS